MSSFDEGKSIFDVERVFEFIDRNNIIKIDKAVRDDYQYFRRPNPTLEVFQRMVNRLIEKHGFTFPFASRNELLETQKNELLEIKQSLELVVRGVSLIQKQVSKHERVLFSLPQSHESKSKVGSSFDFKFDRMISNQAMMLNRIERIENCLHERNAEQSNTNSDMKATSPKIKNRDPPNLEESEKIMKEDPRISRSLRPNTSSVETSPSVQKPSSLGELKSKVPSIFYDSVRNRRGSYTEPKRRKMMMKKKKKKKTQPFREGRKRPTTSETLPSEEEKDHHQSKFDKFQVDSFLKDYSSKMKQRKRKTKPPEMKEETRPVNQVKLEVRKESGSALSEPEEVGKIIPLSLVVYGSSQSVLKREFCVKWNGKILPSTKIYRQKSKSTGLDRFRFEVRIEKRGMNTIYLRYLDQNPVEMMMTGVWTLDLSKTKMRVVVKKKFPNSKNEKWRRSFPCLVERIDRSIEGSVFELSQDELDYMKRVGEKMTKFGEPGDLEREGMKVWEKDEVYCVVNYRNEYDMVDLYEEGVVITMRRLGSGDQQTREIKLQNNNNKSKRGNYVGYVPTDLAGEFELSLADKVEIIRIYPHQSHKKSPSTKKKKKSSSDGRTRFRSAPVSERRDPENKIDTTPYSSSTRRKRRKNLPYDENNVPVPQYIPSSVTEEKSKKNRKEIRIHICGNVGVVKDFPKKLKENLDIFGVRSVILQEKVNRTKFHSYQMTWRRKMFDVHLRLNSDSYSSLMDETGEEMKYLAKNSTTRTAIHIHFVPFVNFNDYSSRHGGKKIKEEDPDYFSGSCLGTIYEEKDDFTFVHASSALKIEETRSKEQSIKLTNFYNDNMRGLCMLLRKVAINLENVKRIANISLD